MSSNIAIEISNVSKIFRMYRNPLDRISDLVLNKTYGSTTQFLALDNISFDVKKGETVGIVGKNGSGKSTLLQIITGTLNPTAGKVKIYGRVGAILELGSGFNPEFSGRDNIFLNAALLGIDKKNTQDLFKDIVDFADIGDFINQPIKNYSSGMIVRLAFAIQAQTNPSILIVDEALAVGDAKFQAKCFDRLRQLREQGTTILFVSHSSEQIVSHCNRAILLDGGIIKCIGEPRDVVNRYMDILFGKSHQKNDLINEEIELLNENIAPVKNRFHGLLDVFHTRISYNSNEYRWGDKKAAILDFYINSEGVDYPTVYRSGSYVTLQVLVKFSSEIQNPIFGVTIKTKEGLTVYGTNTDMAEFDKMPNIGAANSQIVFNVGFTVRLSPGDYFISLGIASEIESEIVPHDRRYDAIHLGVGDEKSFFGIADLDLTFNFLESESKF